ncbi:hypothetical protein ACODT5_01805 [Streptomyces sp. 5.8]|uniref:hypothetical protein n=1 Tax=Streptomyces sp. 5.8 TaxID=3406571 RepID=UPI003BB57017
MPLEHAVQQRRTESKGIRKEDEGTSVTPKKAHLTQPEMRSLDCWSGQAPAHQDWAGSQEEFTARVAAEEDRLGIFLSRQDGPRKAAQAMLDALHGALTAYARWKNIPEESIDSLVRQAFFQDDPGSAGQTGIDGAHARFESLRSPGANTREVMTAVYNASYAKIFGHAGDPDVLSLKGIIGDFFLSPAADIGAAADSVRTAGLNSTYLGALADFVTKAAETGSGNPDVFCPPWLAQYSSADDADNYQLAMEGRKFRSSIEHPRVSVGDLLTAGEPMGDSEMEYFRSFVYAFTRTDLATTTHTVEEALAKYGAKSLAELRKHTDVALVRDNYTTAEDGTLVVDSVDVTAGKVKWARVPRDSRQPQVPDADIPLPWRTGEEYFTVAPDSAWYKDVHGNKGYPVRTGTSGTTMRMLVSYGALGAPGGRPTDFLYALMAWMLPRHDHSLYEIFRGAQMTARTGAGPSPQRPGFTGGCTLDEEDGKLTGLLRLIDAPNGLRDAYPLLAAALAQDFPGRLTPGTCSPAP